MKHVLLSLTGLALLGGAATSCKSKTEAPGADAAVTTTTTTTTPAAAPPASADQPAATGPAATFDLSAVPVSTANLGKFPYLSGLKGYKINVPDDSTFYEFDRSYVYDGHNLIPVEGKLLKREYIAIDEKKETSELMQQRNYENLITSLGGVKVSSGDVPEEAAEKVGRDEYNKHSNGLDRSGIDTYVIRQKDKEVWIQLHPDHYRYYLNVTERAAMPQHASTIPADELKKN